MSVSTAGPEPQTPDLSGPEPRRLDFSRHWALPIEHFERKKHWWNENYGEWQDTLLSACACASAGSPFKAQAGWKTKVTRGPEAPYKINIFSSSVLWIFHDFSTLAVFCEHRYFENSNDMSWGRAAKHTFNDICRRFCAPSFSKPYLAYFFEKECFYPQFSVPWPTAGGLLGWTTVGWAGHWCAPLHGHKWNLCTMTTAYQQLCRFMYMNHKQTYRLTYHHKCTTHQRPCRFMCMNHKQTYQVMCHHKWTKSKHINSPTTASAQRSNTYVVSTTWITSKHINSRATTRAQRINTYATSMRMNHKQTCQLMYHHKCTAHQHLCLFNADEPKTNISIHVSPHVHSVSTPISCHHKCTAY